jgi:hypothetical protein
MYIPSGGPGFRVWLAERKRERKRERERERERGSRVVGRMVGACCCCSMAKGMNTKSL